MKALLLLLIALQAAPKWDWVKNDERGIILKAAHAPSTLRIPFPRGTRIKLEITADSGVSFALANQLAANTFDKNTLTCVNREVFKVTVICAVPTDTSVFVIEDERKAGTLAAGVMGRGSDATAKLAAQNKVTIALYKWKCVENCSNR